MPHATISRDTNIRLRICVYTCRSILYLVKAENRCFLDLLLYNSDNAYSCSDARTIGVRYTVRMEFILNLRIYSLRVLLLEVPVTVTVTVTTVRKTYDRNYIELIALLRLDSFKIKPSVVNSLSLIATKTDVVIPTYNIHILSSSYWVITNPIKSYRIYRRR